MRIFVIANASKRKAKPLGVLIWQPSLESNQGVFSLELCSTCDERRLPLSLSFCARRADGRATPAESEEWVRSRIVPENRHNIAEVLRANGLTEYSAVELLAAHQGRSSDDDLLVYEVEVPQGFASDCFEQKLGGAEAEAGLGPQAPWRADRIVGSLVRRRLGREVRYAFVDLAKPSAAHHDESPDNAGDSSALSTAAQRIGGEIRAQRREQGLTQKQLAARAGITQAVLSRTESGAGNPTLSLLEAIAEALDTKLNISLDA